MRNIRYWALDQQPWLRGAKLNAFVCGAKRRFALRAIRFVYSVPFLRAVEEDGYLAADDYIEAGGEPVCCCDCGEMLPAFRPVRSPDLVR